MKCNFDYCIYNNNFECILDEIEMDASGRCATCIIVSLSDEEIAELKKIQLQYFTK